MCVAADWHSVIELMKQFQQVLWKLSKHDRVSSGWAAEMWALKQVRFKINEFTELYMMQRTKIQSLKSAWNIPSGKDQFEKLKDAKISFVFMNV